MDPSAKTDDHVLSLSLALRKPIPTADQRLRALGRLARFQYVRVALAEAMQP